MHISLHFDRCLYIDPHGSENQQRSGQSSIRSRKHKEKLFAQRKSQIVFQEKKETVSPLCSSGGVKLYQCAAGLRVF